MKFSFTLFGALVATSTGARVSSAYTFEEFRAEFNKDYVTEAETAYRRQVFGESLKQALEHNGGTSKHAWQMAINQFSDRTEAEFRGSHGWTPSSASGLKMRSAPPLPSNFNASALPTEVDWRQKGVVTEIKNQGFCGSCWAFGSTENVESHLALNTSTLTELSPQNLVSCSDNPTNCGGTGGCGGSIAQLAFDYIEKNGLASEADYPYTSGTTSTEGACERDSIKATAHIDGWVTLESNNYDAVMNALANVGPLTINVDAIPMQSYGGGLFTHCSIDKTHIDHVVQLVGYGTDDDLGLDYWIIRNSWGTSWGEAGYMKLLRHSPKDDWCMLDIYPADGTGCDGGPGTVTTCGSCGILYDVSYPTGTSL